MRKYLTALSGIFALLIGSIAAQAEQTAVLWWDGSPPYDGATNPQDRAAMATYIDRFEGGARFDVTFKHATNRGVLATTLAGATYDIIVLDVTTTRNNFSSADLDALRAHYASGKRALMLDGTLWVRNARPGPKTVFPGPNGASAALLMNQIAALADAGAGC